MTMTTLLCTVLIGLTLAAVMWKLIDGVWPWNTTGLWEECGKKAEHRPTDIYITLPDVPEVKRYDVYALGKLPSGKIEEFVVESGFFDCTMEDFDQAFRCGHFDSYLNGKEIRTKNEKTGLLTRKRVRYVGLKFSRCVEVTK